jgi:hypothetical protein
MYAWTDPENNVIGATSMGIRGHNLYVSNFYLPIILQFHLGLARTHCCQVTTMTCWIHPVLDPLMKMLDNMFC